MDVPTIKDSLWKDIERILPPAKPRRKRYPGRKPLSDREVLNGIIYILRTGIPFDVLPKNLGYGSGMTCWNRLTAWKQAGVWPKLQRLLTERVPGAGKIDWYRVEQLNSRKQSKRLSVR